MTICDLHRKRIFLTARACVGHPFRHQGRDPETGLDCVGLIVYVAKTLGLSGFDLTDYKKIPGREAISRYANAAGFEPRPKADMAPGDVVILKFGRYIEHSAIVSDRGIIHACEKYGRVVEHSLNEEWRTRISAAYVFPEWTSDSALNSSSNLSNDI
ncbi:MAG: C40 family peptidase [Emcibacter sp.]|nr:C40 family peptidase [Emcibacter sp.]